MAMKKDEMQGHWVEYSALIEKARRAQREGDHREAVRQAVSSWDHVDGMMQYQRKYEDAESVSIEGIDVALKWAPLLLDVQTLDTLEALLKSQRRIEKGTSANVANNLAEARALMWDAHRLWNHIEQNADAKQDGLRGALGNEQEHWRSIAEAWDTMGLVRRTPDGRSYRLALCTRLDERVLAKCPSCGVVAKAAKRKFLGALSCPKCRATALFVILAREPTAIVKE